MSSFFGLLADCACEREVLSVCCTCERAVSFGPSERWVLSGHERGVLSGCCERGAPSGREIQATQLDPKAWPLQDQWVEVQSGGT